MGELWRLIQEHLDQQQYPVSDRQFAARVGVSPTTVGKWRAGDIATMPKAGTLRRIANVIGKPYETVLQAALRDGSYAPGADDGTATNRVRIVHTQAPSGGRRVEAVVPEDLHGDDATDDRTSEPASTTKHGRNKRP